MLDARQPTPSIQPPRLLDQVVARVRVLHYSIRTERAYLDWIKRFILFPCWFKTPAFRPVGAPNPALKGEV